MEFESLLPQAISAALATAALIVASHATDPTQSSPRSADGVELTGGQ
ncbi:hypothetical protein [Corynebacterium casei]